MRLDLALEKSSEINFGRIRQMINGCDPKSSPFRGRSERWTLSLPQFKSRSRRGGIQEEDLVPIDHRGCGAVAMWFPHRPSIKRLQLTRARSHVSEASQPDETILVIQVAKLSDHDHAGRFLGLDELPLEEWDE